MTTPEQQALLDDLISHLDDAATHVKALIAENLALKAELERVKAERDDWGKRWHQERRKVAELRYPGMTGVVKPMAEELAAIKGAGEPVAWALWLPGESTPRQLHLSKDASLSAAGRWPEAYQGCVHVPLYTRPCVPLTDEPELLEALKRLSFAAQTTGGVAGRDEGLCAAIDAATAVIAKVVAHTKGAKG